MYFKLEGKIDVAQMIAQKGGIDALKFCNQILENDIKITEFLTCAEVNRWKKFYSDMNPKQKLNEDLVQKDVTEEEIKCEFTKFFVPLSLESCRLTIIDPYIFAKNTPVDLLVSILNENVKSKKLRIITNDVNSDILIRTSVEQKLAKLGFTVDFVNDKKIHDRWWYTRKKGFLTGTSFNGIGKKMTIMTLLNDKDLSDIIDKFGI